MKPEAQFLTDPMHCKIPLKHVSRNVLNIFLTRYLQEAPQQLGA